MDTCLETSYSKKLALPGYSGCQHSTTIKTGVSDPRQIQAEKSRQLPQSRVDFEVQRPGFLQKTKGNSQNGHTNGNRTRFLGSWSCSPKQRRLIVRFVEEHKLDKNQVEALAQDLFGESVRELNKLEASGLIDELISQTCPANCQLSLSLRKPIRKRRTTMELQNDLR